MKVKDLLQQRREDILQLAAKHGAYNVRIIGSVVRGEEGEDSDVDFLVEMEPDRTLLDWVGLIQDLEDLLGRKVHVATLKGLETDLRERILSEAVLLSAMMLPI